MTHVETPGSVGSYFFFLNLKSFIDLLPYAIFLRFFYGEPYTTWTGSNGESFYPSSAVPSGKNPANLIDVQPGRVLFSNQV